jgi:hypothetical protein
VSVNLWFEHHIDAFLTACAQGRDWRAACAEAERNIGDKPRRVLTQRGLFEKGIRYSRQHLVRRVADGNFPAPFRMPDRVEPEVKVAIRARAVAAARAKRERAQSLSESMKE